MILNNNDKYIIFIVPFFNLPKHIGNYRVRRFIKWFNNYGYKVIVFSHGKSTIKKTDWGVNYTIDSKILITLDKLLVIGEKFYPIKLLYILIKIFLKVVLIPDEERLWNNKISHNKSVLQIAKKASLIIASSPLESVHVASYKLSKKVNVPFIVDLRDGWLDEPLSLGFISKLKLRNIFEQKLEQKIYYKAKQIFVTSNNWKQALVSRYSELENKVTVLTNAYPSHYGSFKKKITNSNSSGGIELLYTGKLSGSRRNQKAKFLFEPLNDDEVINGFEIEIKIVGDLRRKDIISLEEIQKSSKNYSVVTEHYVVPEKLLQLIENSSGLLLLAVSLNVIPAKFYEYVLSRKPVLAITNKNSSVWNISKELPQFFVYDLGGKKEYNQKITKSFLMACKNGGFNSLVPEKYSEDYLEKIFKEKIGKVLNHLNNEG